MEDCGPTIPESFANYIDYIAMGEDMEMNSEFITVQKTHDEIHIYGGG